MNSKVIKNSKKSTKNISFEAINNDYSYGNYGDFKVIIMNRNGYINATKICYDMKTKNGNKKEFKQWKFNSISQEILIEISNETHITMDNLLIPITGGKIMEIRGTYVHPLLLTHIAYWISPKFAIKESLWIEEWKNFSNENLFKYYYTLSNLEPLQNNNKEKLIQKKLHKKLGGQTEVTTKVGDIDLLTNDSLIEIKTYDNWKYGIGQIIAYSTFHPDKNKYLYLFDVGDKNTKIINLISYFNKIKN